MRDGERWTALHARIAAASGAFGLTGARSYALYRYVGEEKGHGQAN